MKVIIASHGKMAHGMKDTLEMITGPHPELSTFGLQPGESLEDFIGILKDHISGIAHDEIFIFTDMLGGTPFNAVCVLSEIFPTLIGFTGVNLPMLLEFYQSCDALPTQELQKNVLQTAHEAILSINELLA